MSKKIFVPIIVFFLSISFVGAQEALSLNSMAPDFKAASNKGKKISLKQLLKKGPVVMVFYRGEWCPHCNYYMHALQDSLHLIEAEGATVVAITPENFENIEKTQAKTSASFHIVYDQGHQIMDAYKVSFKLGAAKHAAYQLAGININEASGNEDRILPVPATYIINSKQKIMGLHFNKEVKQRMPIKDIVDILKENAKNE